MEIVFHIGAHATDEGALLRSLLRNRDLLASEGVAVPGPSRYRRLLREAMTTHRGDPLSPAGREVILEAANDVEDADRLVFFNDSFLCVPARVMEGGMLYGRAPKAAWLRALFPDDRVEFFVALRNPATFVPALARIMGDGAPTAEDVLDGADPMALSWSGFLARLREAVPDAPITAWANEDTPMIWPDLLCAIAGLEAGAPIEGGLDMAERLLTRAGRFRIQAYMEKTPPGDPAQWRRTVSTFLARYAVEEKVTETLDLPGWSGELVDALTAAYEDDLARVAALEGVRFLAP